MWFWVAGLVATAQADCPDDSHARALHASGRIEYAFANVDEPAFATAAADLRGAMPCIRTALSPLDAAGLHRAMAIVFFTEGDDAAAKRAWASFRALQPAWAPSNALMPPGHDLRRAYDEAAALETTTTKAPYQPPGGWIVDGTTTDDLPVGRPYVLQVVGDGGAIVGTLYQLDVAVPEPARFGFATDTKADPWVGPRLRVAALGAVGSRTEAQAPEPGWGDLWAASESGGVGLGGELGARWTPVAPLAVEADALLLPQGSRLSAHAAAGVPLGPVALRARVGAATSTIVERGAAGDVTHRMGGPSFGAEAEAHFEAVSLLVAAEHTLATTVPYETWGRLSADVPLAGPLAVTASVTGWSRRAEVVGGGETLAVLRSGAVLGAAGLAARW